jgi:Platelet-activating factor acetylhydrolase, isoform II
MKLPIFIILHLMNGLRAGRLCAESALRRGMQFILVAILACVPASAQSTPSVPRADAPELAAIGPDAVGFRSLTFVHRDQPDLQAADPKTGTVPLHDRALVVDVWYPATVKRGAKPVTYRAAFWGEPPHPPVSFTVPGLAVRGAQAKGASHPLVIVSHGYSNAPAVMTWLAENLASKGYVVAGIHHEDPDPYTVSPDKRAAPNFNRPQDIAFEGDAGRAD